MTLVVRLPGGGVGRERCLRLRGRRRGRLGRRTVFVPAVVGRRSGHDGHRALVTTVVAAGRGCVAAAVVAAVVAAGRGCVVVATGGRAGRAAVVIVVIVAGAGAPACGGRVVVIVVAAGGRSRPDALRGAPVVVVPSAGGGTGPRARAGTAAGLAPAGLTPAGLTPARLPVAALAPRLGLAGLARVGARFGWRPCTGGASAGFGPLLGRGGLRAGLRARDAPAVARGRPGHREQRHGPGGHGRRGLRHQRRAGRVHQLGDPH